MKRLHGKTALITGAADGMGKAEALLFAREGARVLATDIQPEKLNAWVQMARQEGLSIESMILDVTAENDWSKALTYLEERYGALHVLVNNAGVFPIGKSSENTSYDEWKRILDINLTGAYLGCKTMLSLLKKSALASVINVASIAGWVGGNGPAYSASKGGLLALSRDLAVEWAKYGIRVNSLSPGGVRTPMTSPIAAMPGMEEIIRQSCPQGRMAEPEELAQGALFLASDESSFMTGADLVMDGGLIAR